MPSPTRFLPRGRRHGRALQAHVVVLAGASTAVGMDAGSSSSPAAAEAPSRPAVPAPAVVARPDGPAIDAGQPAAEDGARRDRADSTRRNARRPVSSEAAVGFMPLYREAARTFGVNWRLIASVHRQETAFSTAPSTYRGLNPFGCCARPMQFNVTNGPPSTWDLYRNAYREGARPERYPNRTDSHPSVYDDFDAIMAAGSLLSDSGAGRSLDGGAWRGTLRYYGLDLYGVTYASEVLARAIAWERDGFCADCGLDQGLVADATAPTATTARAILPRNRRPRATRPRRRPLPRRTRPPRPRPPTSTQPSAPPAKPSPGDCSEIEQVLGC